MATLEFTGPHGEDLVFDFSNPAQINQAWGQIIAHMGQEGIMGEHSSAHGAFTPDPFLPDGSADPSLSPPARSGVGNSSEDDPRFDNPDFEGNNLSVGGNGLHGVFQALRFGDPFPGNPVESQIDPFLPILHGQVSVELLI
jgi:hypothetical protein